ncbi:MAG: hypothetical protein GXP08_10870 [Gammaproteobacteria bacterium]|nr:hypothetical protein [Gammaproteobacteria bacterium]
MIINKCFVFLLTVLLFACGSPYSSHHDKVKLALDQVDYGDGISKTEAKAIADAYLIHYGKYKGRASYAKISDGGGQWFGEVIVVMQLASPVIVDMPPVVVNKVSGEVSWKFGPFIERITLEDAQTST